MFSNKIFITLILLFTFIPAFSEIKIIKTSEEFTNIIENSKDRLLVFDLYADWCMPCKILTPMLEKISVEKKDQASFYKINVDKFPQIAQAFGVSGIPYVVFVKNKTGLSALTGVQSREAYIKTIDEFSSGNPIADGEIIDGVRIIKRSSLTGPGNIHVYRGDKVKLIMDDIKFPYSLKIPQYSIDQDARTGEKMEITFKAKEIGTHPIFCNGQCPDGDNSQIGQIIVLQYSPESAIFKDLNAIEFRSIIKDKNPLILDVRTVNEYRDGHLKDALLVPVKELASKIDKISSHKNKPIAIYCRSGNRSTVASQILIKEGFKEIYNLRPGIKGWEKEKYPIIK